MVNCIEKLDHLSLFINNDKSVGYSYLMKKFDMFAPALRLENSKQSIRLS